MGKFGQRDNPNEFYGINGNMLFMVDPRVAQKDKVVTGYTYQKPPRLSCIATTKEGYIATGSEKGEIRLFNSVSKRAKTLCPGQGHPIIGIDTTAGGEWVLATTERYLLLFQTKVPEMTKTGFEASVINKNVSYRTRFVVEVAQPRMVKLTLKKEDTVRYGIHRVCFSTARFNSGDDVSEDWIITSTGKHLVIWNFAKVKRGIYDDYFVRICIFSTLTVNRSEKSKIKS